MRLAYAGESTMERRRVVKEDGRELSVCVNELELGGGSGELWPMDLTSALEDEILFPSFSGCGTGVDAPIFPSPMFSCSLNK